jgi:hypothetical protein
MSIETVTVRANSDTIHNGGKLYLIVEVCQSRWKKREQETEAAARL